MIARALAAAATLAVAAVLACAPAVAAQESGALPQGGSYVSAPDPTLVPRRSACGTARLSDGYGSVSQPGLMRIAATAASSSKLVSGRSLSETVRDLGGRLYIEVFPDIVGVHAVVPAASARRVAAAMTAAYFAPSIDADALKSAQRDAAVLSSSSVTRPTRRCTICSSPKSSRDARLASLRFPPAFRRLRQFNSTP